MLLRLMSSLTEQSKVDNKMCTDNRKHFQEHTLVYDRLQVTKLVIFMSADSQRSRRWRDFTGAECAVILGLIKAIDPAALLSSLHLFSSQETVARRTVKKNDTSLDVLCLPEMEDALKGMCIALSTVWGERAEPSANGSAANHLWNGLDELNFQFGALGVLGIDVGAVSGGWGGTL
jgi:hypothetical protein